MNPEPKGRASESGGCADGDGGSTPRARARSDSRTDPPSRTEPLAATGPRVVVVSDRRPGRGAGLGPGMLTFCHPFFGACVSSTRMGFGAGASCKKRV